MENTFENNVYKYFNTSLDVNTKYHCYRVSEYAVLLGKKAGLPSSDLESLKKGALFHDVGKSQIPNYIIQKGSKLTDTEYSRIKTHSLIGSNIMEQSSISYDIISIVKYHHEKFDGTGYPNNLSGDQIPYLARITAIADCFDAMTSKRSYNNVLSIEQVKEEFNKCKGTQFDPNLTNIFLDILENNYYEIEKIQKKYGDTF